MLPLGHELLQNLEANEGLISQVDSFSGAGSLEACQAPGPYYSEETSGIGTYLGKIELDRLGNVWPMIAKTSPSVIEPRVKRIWLQRCIGPIYSHTY